MSPAERHEHGPDFDADAILQLLSALRRTSAAVSEWQRRQVEAGFTTNQALVLHHLVVHGDATPSDLAEWMHITRGSVTPVVKRLEDLGLVRRRIDDDDGRKQWLEATPEAREIADEVQAEALDPAVGVFEGWPAKRIRRLAADLEEILAAPVFGGP